MEGDISYWKCTYHFSNMDELVAHLYYIRDWGALKLYIEEGQSKKLYKRERHYSFDIDDITYDFFFSTFQLKNEYRNDNKGKQVYETIEELDGYMKRNEDYFNSQIEKIIKSFSGDKSNSKLIRLTENKFGNCPNRIIDNNVETIFNDSTAQRICNIISTPFIRNLLKSPIENNRFIHEIAMNCYRKYGGHILTFLLSLPHMRFGKNETYLIKSYHNTEGKIPSFKFKYGSNSDEFYICFYDKMRRMTSNQKVALMVNKSKDQILGYINYEGYLEYRTNHEKVQLTLFVDKLNSKNLYCEIELGKCIRCGKELTDPISLRAGYGRDCANELGIAYE